jgi:hypothetical protein
MNAEEQQAFKDTLCEVFRPGVGVSIGVCREIMSGMVSTLEGIGATPEQGVFVFATVVGSFIRTAFETGDQDRFAKLAERAIAHAILPAAETETAAEGGDEQA